jgi:ribose/xylose/arabinose/galactoside ABC-type transport system permease subunit
MKEPIVTEQGMAADVGEMPGAEATSAFSRARTMPNAGNSRMRDWIDKIGPLIGLICVVVLFSVLRPHTFATFDNAQLILLQTAVVGMAALGMTLIIVSGGIDLSVGSNIALCTVSIALLLARGVSPIVAALGGVLTGALCGFVIGSLITRLKLAPFIVTLGMWGALRGLAKGLANEKTVEAPETGLNSLLNSLPDNQKWMIFPPGVWLTLIFAVGVAAMLRYTRFGRCIFAVGSNEQTARLCGVPVERTKLLIYVLAASLVGIAGILQFSYLTLGDPTTATGLELDIIAAVVIGGASLSGGQGSVFGTLVGALIMTCVANGCTKLELANWVQEIVTGGIIIAAVTLDRFRHRTS